MRVLVTGHQGYLGCVVTSLLDSHGLDVVGVDAGLFADALIGPLPDVPAVRADIRDIDAEVFRDVDAVVHLAALSNDPLGRVRRRWTHAINVEATARLGALARAAGVGRFAPGPSTPARRRRRSGDCSTLRDPASAPSSSATARSTARRRACASTPSSTTSSPPA